MPALKFKGIKEEKLIKISKDIIDELEEAIECPRDYFTMEIIQSKFIFDQQVVDGYPFVEVQWFDRGQEIQDKVAKIITEYIMSIGYRNVDVIFNCLDKNKYYENGKHF